MADDHYAVLGVPNDASAADIKKAFREIARKCHPDVAGDDRDAEERFKQARLAYETLMDPVTRARYDRRAQRRASGGGAPPPGGSFFDAFWQASERAAQARGQTGSKPGQAGRKNPGNAVGLDDLFDDFGDFGFDAGKGGSKRSPVEPGGGPTGGAGRGGGEVPRQGEDVHVDLEVPADVARGGGSVTAVYHRLQRSDSWRPGAPDPGLVRIQDIADVRIVPGTRSGAVLREKGLGDSGPHGGPYGDLVATVRIVAPRPAPQDPRPPAEEPRAEGPSLFPQADALLDLTLVEALLGGRVAVDTPQGRIRATIPPCTSSGVRMRLKGKGKVQADGTIGDWYVLTRIVVPRRLDDESRALIEAFARLNPVPTEPE